MRRNLYWMMAIVPAVCAALGGAAISAQDKYTVRVPGGLSFSEFKGYENWQAVSISKTDHAFALILANPVMIEAYRSGIPGNGKPFPEGSKIAKVHYKPVKSDDAPDPSTELPGGAGQRRFHREGQQAVYGPGQRRVGICRVQL
ncbi:cytochrome P460 family protein [Hyphomicrobium sp. B1]|uniref:cytochrome P460 family protein n=1 Tax=Hyphomicrobium sp. B1 TaxID=3075651 RepID=UPI003C2E0729